MSTAAALQNQVALVTGASRGIGHGIALELGRLGAFVVGTATSAAGADAITAALGAGWPGRPWRRAGCDRWRAGRGGGR